jgi:O-antigen/teichoic acid export membrane protein
LALAFASGLYGSRVINIVANFGADLSIGVLASPAAAGTYRLASRMVFGFTEIWFQPIKTIAWVRFSSAVRDRLGLDQEWLGLMMVLSMLAWPTLGGVAVLSDQLTVTVLGSNWLAAGPIVSILALAKSAELFEIFLDPLLGTEGASHRLFRIRIVACVVAVAGFSALAPFGAPAAAVAQVGTYLMLAIVTIRIGLKRTGVTARGLLLTLLPGAATTLLTVVSAAAAAGLAGRSGWPPIAQFACEIAAGALAWAFAVGVVFRGRVWGMIMKLKDQNTMPAAI